MYAWYDENPRSRNTISVPVIWVGIILSLLVHFAAMWVWVPRMHALTLEGPDKQGVSPLAVVLAAPPGPRAPAPPLEPTPTPAPVQEVRPRVVRPVPAKPPPRVLSTVPQVPNPDALRVPPPLAVPPPPAPATPPTPQPRPPVEGDLASFIAARKRARGEPEPSGSQGVAPNAPPVDDDRARRDRIVAENLAVRTPTFGGDTRNSGGVFQIREVGTTEAQFSFFGWNKDIKRRLNQKIEVQKGNNPDIRIAVVRKMISIIREYEDGDFQWESPKVGHPVTLSARPADNAELEKYMMREFFGPDPAQR